MWRELLAAATLGAALAAALPAHALRLTPIVAEFAPKGAGANQIFRLENETDAPVAVQVSMTVREMDVDGNEELREDEDHWVVFPPQLVLLPKENRSIRVQWIGDPAPAQELPFRIIAEQLPVELGDGTERGAQVKLLVRYEGAAYVVPAGAAPDPVVEAAGAVRRPDGSAGLAITVLNRGTAHALLNDLKLHVRPQRGGAETMLAGDALRGMAGENVLGGKRRRFVIAWPRELPQGDVNARLEYRAAP